MPASAAVLSIRPSDQAVLRRWANAAQAPAVLVRRARTLLLAAEGVANSEIAERLGATRPTVIASWLNLVEVFFASSSAKRCDTVTSPASRS